MKKIYLILFSGWLLLLVANSNGQGQRSFRISSPDKSTNKERTPLQTRKTNIEKIDSFTQKIDIPENIPITHPRIYTDYNAQQQLKNKLQKATWAKNIVENIKHRLEPYMARFAEDTNWMVSRLQMYWESHHTDIYLKGNYFVKAEGKAPVPTVRYAGTRDWATIYKAPSLEDVIPYSDKANGTIYVLTGNKGEWIAPEKTGFIIEEINERILSFAQDAAFLYWYTGEENYARFASNIFTTYVTGLYYLNPPITPEDDPEGHISGLTSFEVIHEAVIIPTTICYDFLFNYIQKKNPHFAMEMVAPVFKKWADNIIAKGVPNNNWNIYEARFLSYLSMALENNNAYPDGKGASYYLDVIYNQNSIRQTGLTESIKGFNSNTGIWHEAPGYSVNVSANFLRIVLLTDRVMPNSLKPMIPVLKKAVIASAQYLMPNGFAVSWGDSHYLELPSQGAEYLIAWSRKYNNKEDEKTFTRQLKFTQNASYDRGENKSLFELFFYVDKLMDTKPSILQDFASTTFYAPNVSWFVQRNGFGKQNGLMISSNASLGEHSHANGISIELYGKGYPLAPDFAAGSSYWQQDHQEFYSQLAAHNTVVVDGKSSYPSMSGTNAFKLKSYYPASAQKENFFKNITFCNLAFTEPSTQSSQLRLISIIRTSENTGYYVDVFRSKKKDVGDVKHEYLYHNIAQTVWLSDARSNPLTLKPTDELSTANGDVVGYNYFTEKSVVDYTGAFTARFELKVDKKEPVQMNLWMAGDSARRIFLVKSPKSSALTNTLVPAVIASSKVPTLVVRQPGEAWTHPFVAVIEPSYANKQSISEIKSFKASSKNDEFVGLEVDGKDSSRQYIFSDVSGTKTNTYQGFEFTGTYAVASQKTGQLQYLFLGNGKVFSKDGYGITAKDSTLTAALSMENGTWKLYAEESLKLKLPFNGKNSKVILQTQNNKGEKKEYRGVINHFGKIKQAVFDLPALAGQWLKIKLNSE